MKKKLTRRFTFFQLMAFAAFASMNYYNIYLKSIGFDSVKLGLLASISSIIGMTTLPVWGVISDKTRSTKLTWIISMIVFGVCYLIIPFFGKLQTLIPLYIVIIVYSIVKQPTHSLQDAWSISVLSTESIRYPEVRKWGSFGFAVMSLIISYIMIGALGLSIDYVFYSAFIFSVILCVSLYMFKEPAVNTGIAEKKTVRINPLLLFKDYHFSTAFIMVIALSVYSSLTSTFYGFILEHAGLDPNSYGTYSGIGAFVQIICMYIVTRFCKGVPQSYILIAGGLFGVAENIMYSIADGKAMMIVACTLWGFDMAINVSVLPGYIHDLVPEEYSATAQTLSGTAAMLFSIIGSSVGGYLIKEIGISRYNLYTAIFQGTLTVLFLITILIGKKIGKRNTI